MAKFYGIIGFGVSEETSPGVWIDDVVERSYTGDMVQNAQRWRDAEDKVNPDTNIADRISIIGDAFAMQNISSMKYVKWRGSTWSVKTIVAQPPRLIMDIGGLYNGNTA